MVFAMGNLCTSCYKQSSTSEDYTPDLEFRRLKQMEAAEKRIHEQQNRGIKNVEAVRKQERIDQQRMKREEEASNMNTKSPLKWQVS
ncbi:small VCP interacting protein [Ptiloglossa arizonensis]|uniref:small VCP interacting protein n=1 Tax=Ptiloglossa arizonensis TaxID=3350558 RepID=UPI003FA0CAD4